MLWYPPVPQLSATNIIYVTVVLSLFFFFFTVVLCPCLALLPDIATTIKERINLSTWMAFMIIAGSAMGMTGSSLLIATWGFRKTGLILGIIAFVSLLGPVIAIKEKKVKSNG